jgi:hypothetical protein
VLHEAVVRPKTSPAGSISPVTRHLRRSAVSQRDGRPLDAAAKARLEPQAGFDFARIRIHDDSSATEAAAALAARAFTVGEDVFLGRSVGPAGSAAAEKTVAHEVAHVAQAYRNEVPAVGVVPSSHPLELEAKRFANLPADAPRARTTLLAPPPLRAGGAVLRDTPDAGVADAGPAPSTTTSTKTPTPSTASPTPATPAPAPQVTQKLYDGAVALIQSRDAALHAILKQGVVGKTVALPKIHISAPAPPPGQPATLTGIDFLYNLKIEAGGVTTGALAQFRAEPPAVGGSQVAPSFTLLLPINVKAPPAGAVNPELLLAEYLFHEGQHLLLHMERFQEGVVPPAQQSGRLVEFNAYKAQKQLSPDYVPLRTDLTKLIQSAGKVAAKAAQETADRVIERILEEHFIFVRERATFPGVPVVTKTIVDAYFVDYLKEENVTVTATTPGIPPLLARMKAVLDFTPPAKSPAAKPSPAPAPTPPAPKPRP